MEKFKKIYSDYKHRVYFFVRKYIQRDEDVEDVVQEIFVHIWKHTQGDGDFVVEAIIFKTCKQEVANFYRKNKLTLFSIDKEEPVDQEDEVHDPHYSDEQISKIESLLDKLPQKSKKLFIQHTIENLSYSQLAKENNVSKTAIGKHINKVIAFLKINLQ